jgi:predicted esterase
VEERTIETSVHGRYIYDDRQSDHLVVGFHGYAETAEIHYQELLKIPGIEAWSICAIQALHPFYAGRSAGGRVAASWMTRQDRELAIADNIRYVQRVLHALPRPKKLVFLGYSQGSAMAWRAAAFGEAADGLIVFGSEMPPEVVPAIAKLPPILVARGTNEEWYTAEKFESDLKQLERADVTKLIYEGGHEWTDEFRSAAGDFLRRVF